MMRRYELTDPDLEPVRHLEPPAFAQLGAMLWLDVRSSEEYTGELGHVPGTLQVPLAELEAAAAEWKPGRRVGLICRSGRRSAAAALTLSNAGHQVFNLLGGTVAWREAGLPTCKHQHPNGEPCELALSRRGAESQRCWR